MHNKKNINKGRVLPEGYFDDMQEKVVSQVSLPSSKSGMTLPENYFDDLQQRVISQTQQQTNSRIIPLWLKTVAACFFVGISIVSLFTFTNDSTPQYTAADTENIEETLLLEQVEDDMTVEQLALLLTDEDLLHLDENTDSDIPMEDIDVSDLEDLL